MSKPGKTRGGISLITTVLAIAAAVIVILCITRIRDMKIQYARLNEESVRLAQEEEELKAKIRDLQGYNENGYDADYVESMARHNLDMVYPGEVIFRTEE